MAYTVAKLAKISGVSVRTLHWYDEIGLLKPAYHGSNGTRYYEEEQLLTLQQILFFRELGFELKKIQKLLGRSDFDQIIALSSHKKVLQKNIQKTKELIKTIDKTIKHLKEDRKMNEQELFSGFSKEQQAEYERQIIERFGDQGKAHIEEGKQNAEKWTHSDKETIKKEFCGICESLTRLLDDKVTPDEIEAQEATRKHYAWLKKFWTPTKETYKAHGRFIVDSDLRKAYEKFHPQLPKYLCEAIQIFSEKEL